MDINVTVNYHENSQGTDISSESNFAGLGNDEDETASLNSRKIFPDAICSEECFE